MVRTAWLGERQVHWAEAHDFRLERFGLDRKSEPGRQCQNGLPTRALCSSAASTAVSVVFAAQPAMSRARLLSVATPRCAPLPRERLPGAGRTLGAVWPFSQGRAMCVRRPSRARPGPAPPTVARRGLTPRVCGITGLRDAACRRQRRPAARGRATPRCQRISPFCACRSRQHPAGLTLILASPCSLPAFAHRQPASIIIGLALCASAAPGDQRLSSARIGC